MTVKAKGIRKTESTTKTSPFNLIEDCGVVIKANGNTMQLRYGAWYDNDPAYDLRLFNKNGKSLRGMTLSGEELEALGKFILSMMEEPKTKAKATTRQTRKKTA